MLPGDSLDAAQARTYAQWIAFGPSIFQAARALRDTGILAEIERAGREGITLATLAGRVGISEYGVRVLVEAGLGVGLVTQKEDRYAATKTAYFLLHDPMTRVNMDFTHDVLYQGMFALEDSVRNGRPEGLRAFGDWSTVYEALAHLPERVRASWLAFDQYYSDNAFPTLLPLVFNWRPRRLMDIGANTGKWAAQCLKHDADVNVTLVDLPGQLAMARRFLGQQDLGARAHYHAANMLDPAAALPTGHDAIWMSQFLDCFGESEIASILKRCHAALSDDGHVFIVEPLWDRQQHPAAAFCLQQTSLYFTALANGTSRMYTSDVMLGLVRQAGFDVVEQHDGIGFVQTLLVCRKVRG